MARLMSSTELKERMDGEEEFVLVDVNDPEDFNKEHIPGATNIPLANLAETVKAELSKNQRIVVYGKDHDDESSNRASDVLEGMGYRKVADFDGGVYAWKRAGFLTEGEEAEIIG
jgi:rhodanese-related sulfurtransferase